MTDPIEFVAMLRALHPGVAHAGIHGKCVRVHLLLADRFGGAPYYDGNHVITKIGTRFYDITGQVAPGPRHAPMDREYLRRALAWDILAEASRRVT